MKKAWYHIVYLVVIIGLTALAFIKKTEAEKYAAEATELAETAKRQEIIALKQATRATEAEGKAMEAVVAAEAAAEKAIQLAKDCQTK